MLLRTTPCCSAILRVAPRYSVLLRNTSCCFAISDGNLFPKKNEAKLLARVAILPTASRYPVSLRDTPCCSAITDGNCFKKRGEAKLLARVTILPIASQYFMLLHSNSISLRDKRWKLGFPKRSETSDKVAILRTASRYFVSYGKKLFKK